MMQTVSHLLHLIEYGWIQRLIYLLYGRDISKIAHFFDAGGVGRLWARRVSLSWGCGRRLRPILCMRIAFEFILDSSACRQSGQPRQSALSAPNCMNEKFILKGTRTYRVFHNPADIFHRLFRNPFRCRGHYRNPPAVNRRAPKSFLLWWSFPRRSGESRTPPFLDGKRHVINHHAFTKGFIHVFKYQNISHSFILQSACRLLYPTQRCLTGKSSIRRRFF